MKTKEFNLSDANTKAFHEARSTDIFPDKEHSEMGQLAKMIRANEKEFIRLLKGWGESEQKNNNIYRKSIDELNNDWIEKIKSLAGEKLIIPIELNKTGGKKNG